MAYAIKSAGYARNAGKRWRGSDVLVLKSLVREGAPLRLISLKLGRPDSAIRAKASALGLQVQSGRTVVAPPPARTLTRTPRRLGAPTPDADAPARQPDLFGHA